MVKMIRTKTIDGKNIELFFNDKKFIAKQNQYDALIDFEDDVFVSEGWIDLHTHCDPNNVLYTSDADDIGYKQGVAMVIDGGSAGASNWYSFYKSTLDKKTIVKAFLNISKNGIYAQSELSNMNDINISIDENDFIVGYKVRMSKSVVGENGLKPLKKFMALKNNNLPVLIHIGNEPPYFKDYVDLLDESCIITHVFNGKNNSLFLDGNPTDQLMLAKNKNVKFDLGHGSESFNYLFAKKINKKQFKLDTISTDIYIKNKENKKVESLALTMSKIRNLDYNWDEIIDCVTKNPARILNLKNWNLNVGSNANATFFKIKKTNKTVVDSFGNSFQLIEEIIPVAVLINGEFIEVGDKHGFN